MVDTAAVRRDLLGDRHSVTQTGVGSAAGLFLLSLAAAAASSALSHTVRTEVLYLLVLCGVVLAVAFAYANGGLLVSWALVLGPAGGGVTFHWWQTLGETSVVALPLSFGGRGAVAFWLSFSLLLGTVGWGVGVFAGGIRRTHVAG